MSPGNWRLAVCGINHKTSSLEQREPLQIGHDEIARATAVFGDLNGILESVIVSTCNRIEFYFIARKNDEPFERIRSFYKKFNNIDIADLEKCFYTKNNKHTVAHLFNVASGIDSMVLGENQVLSQLKDAYSSACAVKTTGKIIHRMFHQAFRVGKMVRSETEMGKGACSVSSAAVEFLKHKIVKMENPSILFIGINQMIGLAASKICKLKHDKFVFANRTPENAVELANRYNSTYFPLDKLQSLIESADLIITCTSSKEPIITKKMIDKFILNKPEKRLTIMDIAVPRDVEIGKDYNSAVEVFDLEDIKQHVKKQQQKRELAIPQAQEIIDRKLSEFKYWFDHVKHEPIYNGLGDAFEKIRQQEVLNILEKLPPDLQDEVNRATRSMVKKLLQVKMRNQQNV